MEGGRKIDKISSKFAKNTKKYSGAYLLTYDKFLGFKFHVCLSQIFPSI